MGEPAPHIEVRTTHTINHLDLIESPKGAEISNPLADSDSARSAENKCFQTKMGKTLDNIKRQKRVSEGKVEIKARKSWRKTASWARFASSKNLVKKKGEKQDGVGGKQVQLQQLDLKKAYEETSGNRKDSVDHLKDKRYDKGARRQSLSPSSKRNKKPSDEEEAKKEAPNEEDDWSRKKDRRAVSLVGIEQISVVSETESVTISGAAHAVRAAIRIDTDGDGKADAVVVDTDGDGSVDTVFPMSKGSRNSVLDSSRPQMQKKHSDRGAVFRVKDGAAKKSSNGTGKKFSSALVQAPGNKPKFDI